MAYYWSNAIFSHQAMAENCKSWRYCITFVANKFVPELVKQRLI